MIKNMKMTFIKNYTFYDCNYMVEFDYKKYFWSKTVKMICFRDIDKRLSLDFGPVSAWFDSKTG